MRWREFSDGNLTENAAAMFRNKVPDVEFIKNGRRVSRSCSPINANAKTAELKTCVDLLYHG